MGSGDGPHRMKEYIVSVTINTQIQLVVEAESEAEKILRYKKNLLSQKNQVFQKSLLEMM